MKMNSRRGNARECNDQARYREHGCGHKGRQAFLFSWDKHNSSIGSKKLSTISKNEAVIHEGSGGCSVSCRAQTLSLLSSWGPGFRSSHHLSVSTISPVLPPSDKAFCLQDSRYEVALNQCFNLENTDLSIKGVNVRS